MKMKKTFIMGLFSMVFGLFSCNAQSDKFQTVDAKEFAEVIADTAVVRLDVRTPKEYDEGHIDGAINIDVQNDNFENQATATLPKDKTIALYCRSGRRSKKAAAILSDQGYKVIELGSGYIGWTEAGMEVKREQLCGGYSEQSALSEEEQQLFANTYKGDVQLTPKSVASQVVAGMNYEYTCSDKDGNIYIVVIYKPLPGHGEAEVTSIEKK